MALFGKGIMDVIRCDETDYLIWKWHPKGLPADSQRANAIRKGSSLRVREGSVAVFVYPQPNGSKQEFIIGPYDGFIDTENLPVLASLMGTLYNGDSPFQAEIYFINTAKLIQTKFVIPYFDVFDSMYRISVPTTVRGSINFQITDYRHFIDLHSLHDFDMESLRLQIDDTLAGLVTDAVANIPKKHHMPLLEMEQRKHEISQFVSEELVEPLMQQYGITVTRVDISTIGFNKDSQNFQKLQTRTQGDFVNGIISHISGTKHNLRSAQEDTHKPNSALDIGLMGKTVSNAFSNMIKGIKKPGSKTPPPLPITQYYVAVDGNQCGPYDMRKLSQMAADGQLTKDSLVWKDGMKKWEIADKIRDLHALFDQPIAPTPPPIPPKNE